MEKVQKGNDNTPRNCLDYFDRLKFCKLSTLHDQRIRGDKIETYKILTGKYDMIAASDVATVTIFTTADNDLRLQKSRTRYDLRKFFFLLTQSSTLLNSPSNNVVHAESANIFKTRLDKFWSNREIFYDYNAELQV